MVERYVEDVCVGGSNPSLGTNRPCSSMVEYRFCNAATPVQSQAGGSINARVVQWIRTPDYESGGRTFKSCRALHVGVVFNRSTAASKPARLGARPSTHANFYA